MLCAWTPGQTVGEAAAQDPDAAFGLGLAMGEIQADLHGMAGPRGSSAWLRPPPPGPGGGRSCTSTFTYKTS